jgi:hypothetical protein
MEGGGGDGGRRWREREGALWGPKGWGPFGSPVDLWGPGTSFGVEVGGSEPFGVGVEDLTTLFKWNLCIITTTLKTSSKTSFKSSFKMPLTVSPK